MARREYESFDSYQSATLTLAATTNPQEVIRFAGRPDNITILRASGTAQVRTRNAGEVPGDWIDVFPNTLVDLKTSAEIVEARDVTGAGGPIISAIGRYASRHIDRRVSRRGPLLADVRARDQGAPEQLEPR